MDLVAKGRSNAFSSWSFCALSSRQLEDGWSDSFVRISGGSAGPGGAQKAKESAQKEEARIRQGSDLYDHYGKASHARKLSTHEGILKPRPSMEGQSEEGSGQQTTNHKSRPFLNMVFKCFWLYFWGLHELKLLPGFQEQLKSTFKPEAPFWSDSAFA